MPDLRLKRVAKEQLAALPEQVRDEIDLALLRIQANPTDEGMPLGRDLAGYWRKRVGGYRIIYRVKGGESLVIVDAIRKRKVAYPRKRSRPRPSEREQPS